MVYKKTWKYILTKDNTCYCRDFGCYRPKAIKYFSDVSEGDTGGYVQGYHNLSQKGNCWVYDYAEILGNAWVKDFAQVHGNVIVEGDSVIKNDI